MGVEVMLDMAGENEWGGDGRAWWQIAGLLRK